MTCVRRLAGARKPVSPAGSPHRSGLRIVRSRSRPSRLLPVLALLLGALGVVSAGPAQAQSSDATLRALSVEVSTDGTNFSAIGIHPEFTAGQRSYDTTVSSSHTHVRVSATANDAGATLEAGKGGGTLTALASGANTAAIALVDGANQVRIRVTAPDNSRRNYYVTVTRGGRVIPLPPRFVEATAGSAKLTLTWTAPVNWGSFPPGGYEVDWYEGASPPSDPADWKKATLTSSPLPATATSYEFTGTYGDHTVADGTTYQLRVRAFSTNPNDAGDTLPSEWVTKSGTPPGQSSTSSDARLGNLTASSATSESGTYSALALTPSTFQASTTSYVATVANATTHVKLTPTANHASATLGVRKGTMGSFTTVASGSPSGAIALDVGSNEITVRVTAQDTETTRDYRVTVTREQAQATPPSGVTLSADDEAPVEGGSVTLTATLDTAAPAGGVTLTLEVVAKVSGTIFTSATATDDYTLPGTISIAAGQTTGTATLATVDDSAVEDNWYSVAGETVVVRAKSTTPALGSKPLVITIVDNDGPFAGRRPDQPTLEGVASGTNAPTATTLTFRIGCVSGGGAAVTDYVLWAENVDDASDHHRAVFTAPGHACATIAETMTGLPGRASATTYRVRAFARSIAGFRSPWSNAVELATTAQQQQGGGEGSEGATGVLTRELAAYAELIAKIHDWRNDPRYANDREHTDRWDRVLLAFRQPVSDASLTAMSAAEAQGFADRGWTRWVEVAAALREIEAAAAPGPVVTIAGGDPVTEGTAAGFTLTAAPAPSADIAVTVSVAQSGAFAAAPALGARTVTIPAGTTSAAFTVATVDDAAGEADGAVVATLAAGTGYTLGDTARASVTVTDDDGGVPDIVTKRATAREGSDDAVVFRVRLNRAAAHTVTVAYATADGARAWAGTPPATAGSDYTASSGTLTFAAGETQKTVSVPILDDAIDEGMEHFLLRFSNPQGAALPARYRETQGLIMNDDHLQAMWLARFGRMVASDAVASVTARLETPRDAGSHVTVAGQRMNFGETGGGEALATVLTGFAQTFGAPSAPAADKDDPFARHRLTSGWNDPAATTGARRVTARELLLGTSFRAVLGQGAGSQWTSWGQGASVSRFSAAVPGLGLTGEAATGSMGMDYERGRLLLGFAMTHSVGEGTASDAGWRYALGSTATMAMPYARLALSDRISVWGLAGTGSGRLSLDLHGAVPQSYRTDLAMTLAATGVRGDLIAPAEPGGFALALKADAFWVRTESDRVTESAFGSLMGAGGESSRVRAMLDGSRTFSFASGAALTPSVELGVRHDAGDAETGTGLEVGAGLGFADPSRGLDMALRVHGLAVHAEDGYDEWGVSGQLRLVPGGAGRGLSASLTPSYGVDPAGTQRLWALPASSGLATNGDAEPSSRFDAEVGYGMALFGGGFTGTPNVGFGLSETAREYRMGWRLTSAVRGDPGFEVSLDATRREPANDNEAEHGVMLRSLIRW